jgi:hypothetical protein
MLILKPVVGKYYKTYLKKTMASIEAERTEKKYDYEGSLAKLLQGQSLKYKDLA